MPTGAIAPKNFTSLHYFALRSGHEKPKPNYGAMAVQGFPCLPACLVKVDYSGEEMICVIILIKYIFAPLSGKEEVCGAGFIHV